MSVTVAGVCIGHCSWGVSVTLNESNGLCVSATVGWGGVSHCSWGVYQSL